MNSSSTISGLAEYKQKHPKLIKALKIIFIGDTVPQKIVHFYVYLILLGAILLYLPISLTSYPNEYSKIVNEDYFNIGGYSALAKQVISQELIDKASVSGYYHLRDNLYLVLDPISNSPKVIQADKYTFLDAIFVAASAFSDTGLSTLIVKSTYSVFGQVVIALLIQIGGIGFIVIAYLLWKLFKSRKPDQNAFSKSIILRAERGNSKIGGTAETIVVAVVFIIIVELIYTLFYALYFNFAPAYEQQIIGFANANSVDQLTSFKTEADLVTVDSNSLIYVNNSPYAIWAGIFHSIASINNAGFDLFGANSLAAYRNDYHAVFLFVTMTEFFIGGIGYPVIFDIYEKIKFSRSKQKLHKFRFSLFTKISLITALVISVLGFVIAASIEMTSAAGSFNIGHVLANQSAQGQIQLVDNLNSSQAITNAIYGENPEFNATWGLLFQTMSTRSAGFSTISNYLYDDASKGIFIALMFIGAAPSSTAGGIRTTTFAVICAAIWAKLRGRKEVRMFRRTISRETVSDSFICFILILILLCLFSVISSVILNANFPENRLSLIDITYELSSAFGTVGLSTGFSAELTRIVPIPIIFVVFLMIVGQLGVSITLLTWVKKNPSGNLYSYPTETLKIG